MPAEPTRPATVSVIVPCRNAADVIAVQLEALSRQRALADWEVIVVDNGSTDGSPEVVARFAGRLPRLRIVAAEGGRGAAYARNTGVRHASADNVAFVDADDEVAPGWLAAVQTALRKHEVVAFRTEAAKLNPDQAQRARSLGQTAGLQVYTYPPYLPYSGATLAVRRALHEKVGGFDEAMLACEDADYCWRLQLAGARIHFAADAVIHVRLRSSLSDMCRQARVWGEWNVALYKKYRPRGMPPLPPFKGLRNLLGIARRAYRLADAEARRPWLWEAAWMTGRVIGSIKHRVWAL